MATEPFHEERFQEALRLLRLAIHAKAEPQFHAVLKKLERLGWLALPHVSAQVGDALLDAPVAWAQTSGLGLGVLTRDAEGTTRRYAIQTPEEWQLVTLTLDALRTFQGAELAQVRSRAQGKLAVVA